MNARVFANGRQGIFTDELDGGDASFPTIPEGDSVFLRFKLVEEIEGAAVLDGRTVNSLSARIGWPDKAPEQGTYRLTIELGASSDETEDIDFDATAAEIKTAIDAILTDGLASLNPCTVTAYQDGLRIVFADNTATVLISCTDNALWPVSFVDVDEISWDEGKAYILQLRQTPAAEETSFSVVTPNAPTVSQKQAGQTIDGLSLNEIQKLTLPPTYVGGSIKIEWKGRKTEIFTLPVSLETLQERLDEIADDDGIFFLTPGTDFVYIEFRGEMAGETHNLMTVEVFEAPPPDYRVRVNTKTDEFRTLMRGADDTGELEVPFNLTLKVDDGEIEDEEETLTFATELTFRKRVSDDVHNASAQIVWNQPRSRLESYPHSPEALMIGNRSVSKIIGNGAATSFDINHNLVENAQEFTADAGTDTLTAVGHNYHNADPLTLANSGGALPDPLVETNTYWVINRTDDTFQLSETPNGSAIDLTDAGTGTHTARIADGTVNGVFIQVWRATGTLTKVPDNAYTAERLSADAVRISGFASTPTAGEYEVSILTVGRPATYQAHQHPALEETPEAKTRIEALEARVALLESQSASGGVLSLPLSAADEIEIPLLPKREFFPLRGRSVVEVPERLGDIDLSMIPRAAGLLPAVHDAATEALPLPVPDPAAEYVDRVFVYSGAADTSGYVDSLKLQSGDFVACNGSKWYRVERFTSPAEVALSSSSESSGSSSSESVAPETTFYPALMTRELFEFAVSERQFRRKRTLEVQAGMELRLIHDPRGRDPRRRNTKIRYALVAEIGDFPEDESPATTGRNLKNVVWRETPVFEWPIVIVTQPTVFHFGLRAIRESDDTLTLKGIVAGELEASTEEAKPDAFDFAVRFRLVRFDTENSKTDPKGILAMSGFARVSGDGLPGDRGKVRIK